MSGSERPRGVDLWGGHFERGPAPLMEQINASIGFDKRLYAQDLVGSRAHARMLATVGLLSTAERDAIVEGLEQIEREIEEDRFPFSTALEDIHLNVEARLTELIGEPGRKLHTARSRNDQVATDFRLWVRAAIDRTDGCSGTFRRRCWRAPRSTPSPSCRASPICRRPSRSRSAIIS